MSLSLSEKLMYSTIRLECYNQKNSSTGTGYFFQFIKNFETGEHHPVIITNKHVIKDMTFCRLTFCLADDNGNPLDEQHHIIEIPNFDLPWVFHPDENIDLCVMPIYTLIKVLEEQGKKIFYNSLDTSMFPNEDQLKELTALEDVVMIGYPNGIWDKINNKPIMRKGTTATHPFLNYNGNKEFLIDMAVFPGSSGSPVFILNEGSYTSAKSNSFTVGNRFFLLGTVWGVSTYLATGEIKVMPIVNKTVLQTQIPNNLGHVIKYERILELEEYYKKVYSL